MWPLLEYVKEDAAIQNLVGIRTRLLIWWREGKRKHVNFSGGILELCNGAKSHFPSLWELLLNYACFPE